MLAPKSTRQLLLEQVQLVEVGLAQLTPELREKVEYPKVNILLDERTLATIPALDAAGQPLLDHYQQPVVKVAVRESYIDSRVGTGSGNTTPAAPSAGVVNDSSNTFDWTPSPDEAELANYEQTLDGGNTVTALSAKPLVVGDVNKAASQVGVRVAAAPGRNHSDWLFNAQAFAATAASPPDPAGPPNLLPGSTSFAGWTYGGSAVAAADGFDGSPGTARKVTTYSGNDAITSPIVTTATTGSLSNSLYIKPLTLARLRAYEASQARQLDFDFVNKVIVTIAGNPVGRLVDVSGLGSGYAGAFRIEMSYPVTTDQNYLQFRRVDSADLGGIPMILWAPQQNAGTEAGPYQPTT